MQNLHPKNKYDLHLSKPQMDLLEKLLCQEIAKHEAGTSPHPPKLLKSIHLKLWEHIKPSPAEKQAQMNAWVRSIYENRFKSVLKSLAS